MAVKKGATRAAGTPARGPGKAVPSFSAQMKGMRAIARKEFMYNLRSAKMGIMIALMVLAVVGGTWGVSKLAEQGKIPEPETQNITQGSDYAIYTVTTLVAFTGSIVSLILAFDAFTREYGEGTLDILLMKPIRPWLIPLGKFLGIWAALSIPTLIVTSSSVVIMRIVVGEFPSLPFALMFIFLSMLLQGITVLIQMFFSLFSKKTSTAIGFGLLVWLFFTIFWPIAPMVYGYLADYEIDSSNNFTDPRWTPLSNRMDLFNPNTAYQLCFTAAGGDIGLSSDGVMAFMPFLSMFLWFVLPLAVLLFAFSRRAARGF